MRVIMMEPMKPAEIKEIDGSLEGMQAIVGGLIELYCPFEDENVGIVVNEEGKLLCLPQSRIVTFHGEIADILAGPAFIVNLDDEEGNFTSLTDDQISRLLPRIDNFEIRC